MVFAKNVNGVLEYAPIELYTEDNVVIELKTYEDYVNQGYKPVVTKKPPYNKNEYELIYNGFIESDVLITLQYELRKRMSEEDKILKMFKEIYDEEINN